MRPGQDFVFNLTAPQSLNLNMSRAIAYFASDRGAAELATPVYTDLACSIVALIEIQERRPDGSNVNQGASFKV